MHRCLVSAVPIARNAGSSSGSCQESIVRNAQLLASWIEVRVRLIHKMGVAELDGGRSIIEVPL